jgi:hypothetical protein
MRPVSREAPARLALIRRGCADSARRASVCVEARTVVSARSYAIWSGACSSGGNKRRTCTFTLNANAIGDGNVQ